MIKQPGCLSEQLLRCTNAPGEYISWSEWDSEASIEQYLASEAGQEIKRHNRNIRDASVLVSTTSRSRRFKRKFGMPHSCLPRRFTQGAMGS
jgi:heme-degrading monooxygenase HmoA